jgi:hypothetical protein
MFCFTTFFFYFDKMSGVLIIFVLRIMFIIVDDTQVYTEKQICLILLILSLHRVRLVEASAKLGVPGSAGAPARSALI